MVMWDYKDTELPVNTTDRSSHMKDMGGKGWELVSVSPNPCLLYTSDAADE